MGTGGDGPSFEIIDKLGKGSFGQVFRCRSAKTGRLVAIKVVKNCSSYATQAPLPRAADSPVGGGATE